MSSDRPASIVERKDLLRARAEFDRTKVAFALHQIRAVVAPVRDPARVAARRPAAVRFARILVPLLGVASVARWLRVVSLSLTAYRIARNWRRMH